MGEAVLVVVDIQGGSGEPAAASDGGGIPIDLTERPDGRHTVVVLRNEEVVFRRMMRVRKEPY